MGKTEKCQECNKPLNKEEVKRYTICKKCKGLLHNLIDKLNEGIEICIK